MTEAAKELHMTQSGVSQHIKTLEDLLHISLFDRIKKRLVPTATASQLYKRCTAGLNEIEQGLQELKQSTQQLTGMVSIGMPVEFGKSTLLPLLSKFSQKHPLVTFRFKLGLAPMMNDMLLKGELDFAIVDDFSMDRRITTTKVYDEVLDLYISQGLLEKHGKPRNQIAFFEALEYIEYQEGEPLLKMWFSHHFKTTKMRLNIKAMILDVHGVERLIEGGMGAGILPLHVVDKMPEANLYCFKGSGRPLKNAIRMAQLEGRSHAPAAAAAMKWLSDALEQVT